MMLPFQVLPVAVHTVLVVASEERKGTIEDTEFKDTNKSNILRIICETV